MLIGSFPVNYAGSHFHIHFSLIHFQRVSRLDVFSTFYDIIFIVYYEKTLADADNI